MGLFDMFRHEAKAVPESPKYEVTTLNETQQSTVIHSLKTATEDFGITSLAELDEYFYQVRDQWLASPESQRADPFALIMMIGIRAGYTLSQNANLCWRWYKDAHGEEIALYHPQHPGCLREVILFPINAMKKRWYGQTEGCPSEWVNHSMNALYARVWDDPQGKKDDEEILAVLAQRVDVTKPRDQIHFLYFTHQDSATKALEVAGKSSWLPYGQQPHHIGADQEGFNWHVAVHREDTAVNSETVAQNRMFFSKLACDYHGIYDGWEACATD
ncbi:ribonuclease E inhibitor RraB [Trueperella sp. LYQ141]|uniref:ribonuclease E inhibitor RraB n=1 Tax=Trueperella sp. LYQ141 TaxID=3391058 RepID=UPI0039833D07